MSIDQVDVVDSVGVDTSTGHVVLTVSDHLEWDEEHLFLLQEKLNTYLRFIEGGELLSFYPDAEGRKIRISIVFKFQPNEVAEIFLKKVRAMVGEGGIKLEWRVFKM